MPKLNRIYTIRDLFKGDSRMRAFRGYTLREIQKDLLAFRFSPRLPQDVAHHIEVAKQLCITGYLFYEHFAVSIHHTAIACEGALRHLYVKSHRSPVVLLPPRRFKRAARRTFDDPSRAVVEVFDALADGWRLEDDREFRGSFGQLVRWARSAETIPRSEHTRWEATLLFRNSLAHGSAMVVMPGWATGFLSRTAWMLNPLFPDPETEAYDEVRKEPARKAAEEMERWSREIEKGWERADET